MKVLIVDDQRIFKEVPFTQLVHKTTSQEGYDALLDGPWAEIWLDHDLGSDSVTSGYGLVEDLLEFMDEYDVPPDEICTGKVWVHSLNPIGATRMVAALTRYFEVARIDPTPYLDFAKMRSENRNPYLVGPRR